MVRKQDRKAVSKQSNYLNRKANNAGNVKKI